MQLVKATLTEMTYDSMKEKLKKVFTNCNPQNQTTVGRGIKVEPVDTTYYNDNYVHGQERQYNTYYNSDGRGLYRGRGRGQKSRYNRQYKCPTPYNHKSSIDSHENQKPKENPLDSQGKVSQCNICHSKFHWANRCPDKHL